ncbi:hypothetical protein [Streptomyces broussonetiae]|uniref:Uncharacterized protein n=1 Tax=Streptomyces broussonetiae TaxID=2686304 RepID=A0A6I6N3F8_9ACTN|nr:hypothetical protein [Streptomyces broussonetiae]QHA06052.1 hypothetical protein GQF42_24650 [Streptomyces broussonetiae]
MSHRFARRLLGRLRRRRRTRTAAAPPQPPYVPRLIDGRVPGIGVGVCLSAEVRK